ARCRLLNRLLAAQEGEAIGPTLALEAARRLAVTESEWAAWAAGRLRPAADQPPDEAAVDRTPGDLGHDREMDSEPVPDLYAIRDRIDELDHALVRLLAERSRLVGEVVRYKRARHMRVVDRAREDDMLVRIAETAKREGLDPRIAQQVLRTIVDGFTLLEVEELGPDA
ncbi:MAG: chorismate mutase, partial [Actinomycetes bacterium]